MKPLLLERDLQAPVRRPHALSGAESPRFEDRVPPRPKSHCACGGRCPRCSGGGNLGGNAHADPAPINSRHPNVLVENFGRWARYTTVSGPIFNQKGVLPLFEWAVDFDTSLEMGYLVQHIRSEWWAENCDGTPFTGQDVTMEYWERWHFENGKNVTKKDRTSAADDTWRRGICDQGKAGQPCPAYAPDTQGIWVMSAELYVVPGFDLGGFTSSTTGRSPAGNLDYTWKEPAGLGRPMAARTIGGTWNFCPPNTTHRQV